MGRPSGYIEDLHNDWAWSLAAEGLTDKEIAEKMGIAKSTLNKWKLENQSFSDSLKNGKETIDAQVQKSLYQRAIGYEYKEKKVIVELDNNGNQKPARIETTEKLVPPDTTAQIFWLKNRQPDKWRDKQVQEIEAGSFLSFLMKTNTIEDDTGKGC